MANFVPPLLMEPEAVRPAGRFTRGLDGALALHDGVTPGGKRFNRFKRPDPFSVDQEQAWRLYEMPRSPTDYGAVGDGVADDAPAIQKALDAITASGRPGSIVFPAGKTFRCGKRLTMDRKLHNLTGWGKLVFDSPTDLVCIRVYGTTTEYGNANGYNGCIDGQLIIDSSARAGSVGVLLDTDVVGSTSGIRITGLTVTRVGTSFRVGSRGYNTEFINCKSFSFDVCFDWRSDAEGAEDADERLTILGGTFFNGELFMRHKRGAGNFYVFSCSVDYTSGLLDCSGKAHFFGVHLESNRWNDRPIKLSGDRATLVLDGGWALMQPPYTKVFHFFDIGDTCTVSASNWTMHTFQNLLVPDAVTPTTLAATTGSGRLLMSKTQIAFRYGGLPRRLMTEDSALANFSFEDETLQTSPVWRSADVNPIRSREGTDAPQGSEPGHNLRLLRNTTAGDPLVGGACLELYKSYGGGSAAAAAVLCLPARYGDAVTAGVRARRKPSRAGNNGRVYTRGGWAALDGLDQYGVPVVRKFVTPGEGTFDLTTDWSVIALGNEAENFYCPSWATHYVMFLDLRDIDGGGSILVDGRWADRF